MLRFVFVPQTKHASIQFPATEFARLITKETMRLFSFQHLNLLDYDNRRLLL